ncbi:MAG: AbrB/MazE/SpoVT family DNA-binding domain-containing protein [Bacteroidota bacterium]
MTARLIQIGNSKGIRLPKNMIEKYRLVDELEIIESEEGIVIKPATKVRDGWDEAFNSAKVSSGSDDDFSDFVSMIDDFDASEWTW